MLCFIEILISTERVPSLSKTYIKIWVKIRWTLIDKFISSMKNMDFKPLVWRGLVKISCYWERFNWVTLISSTITLAYLHDILVKGANITGHFLIPYKILSELAMEQNTCPLCWKFNPNPKETFKQFANSQNELNLFNLQCCSPKKYFMYEKVRFQSCS